MSSAIRVGIQANAWQRELSVKEHLGDVLRQVAAAGYEGVELPAWSFDLQHPGPVRELLAGTGVAPIAIHLGGNFFDAALFGEKTLPAARQVAACAAALGAESVVLTAAAKDAALTTVPFGSTSPHGRETPTHARKTADELRTQRDALAEVARLNRDHGLATHYHNHATEFAHDGEELRSILEVDPALLSLCFDIGNAARALPGEALPAAMARCCDRIGYLHFKDLKGATLAEALGEGDVDFAPIGALVRERGFRGWAAAEIEPAHGMVAMRSVAEDAAISFRFIRETLGIA